MSSVLRIAMDLGARAGRGLGSGLAPPIRWLAFASLGLSAACGSVGRIEDPLAESVSVARAPVGVSEAAARQLELAAAAEEIQALLAALNETGGWRERGYFTSDEHNAVEWLLFRFVNNHRAFWGEIDWLGGVELTHTTPSDRPGAHLLMLQAGLSLADSGAFLVDEFQSDPAAVAKLNEAFYRSEIAAGTFEKLRLALTDPKRRKVLADAWRLHEQALDAPHGAAMREAATDPALALIASSLAPLWARVEKRMESIDAEPSRIVEKVDHGVVAETARASQRSFEAVGYDTRALVFKNVSRIKSPKAHLIRFSKSQKQQLHDSLRAGDLILTYTAGYVSDVFIPGTFKHGITYVGVADDRAAAGLTAASVPRLARARKDRFAADLARDRMPDGTRADLIEAVAEGVKLSNLDRILDTHVNRLLVLRPQIDDAERTAFLASVFAFLGDPYDFRFDFADASRQVCTEVIYRALNGKSGIDFALTPRAGHPTLSADDVVLYHFATPGHFEIVVFAEEDPDDRDHAARLWTGDPAEKRLKARMANP